LSFVVAGSVHDAFAPAPHHHFLAIGKQADHKPANAYYSLPVRGPFCQLCLLLPSTSAQATTAPPPLDRLIDIDNGIEAGVG
jgi:hypothetical protein